MLVGGVLAAALLDRRPASRASARTRYKAFYQHTLEVHDRTPLTNHMGLRVLIAHKWGPGQKSGRMKYTKDDKLVDPFGSGRRCATRATTSTSGSPT